MTLRLTDRVVYNDCVLRVLLEERQDVDARRVEDVQGRHPPEAAKGHVLNLF